MEEERKKKEIYMEMKRIKGVGLVMVKTKI